MIKNKKAVYFICNNRSWGHVGAHVWDILQEEGYLKENGGITFAGEEVIKYTDQNNNIFYGNILRKEEQ
ncbi:hypothetical protein [Clostridium beijerinckii]|uniref:hypothetical protein n=1 Tax=Clostridium beijerinckii TaxID=1520 RepID=UPI00156EB31F|nr:hypothetical protein [Clostridium beijerinckii]NRT72457.1 hypothetical protein [Clostridium beijerinckii]